MHSVAKAYIIVFAICAFLVAFMPIFGIIKIAGFSFLAIALPLTNFVRTPAQNLMDAWSMLAVARAKRAPFGVMRLWGSIGWAISCVLLSFVAEKAGIPVVFMLSGFISMGCLLYTSIDGPTLKDILRMRGKLPVRQCIQIMLNLCEAIQTAHDNGVIHRDLKPHNILVTPEGEVKITDFGIAKFVGSSTMTMESDNVLGSVHYIAPEQASGGETDEKTDRCV